MDKAASLSDRSFECQLIEKITHRLDVNASRWEGLTLAHFNDGVAGVSKKHRCNRNKDPNTAINTILLNTIRWLSGSEIKIPNTVG
jgi:hypothetical protein